MRKVVFLFTSGLVVVFSIAHFTNLNTTELEQLWWKAGAGDKGDLGDFLQFDESNLKGDTIYRKGKPAAIIVYSGQYLIRPSPIMYVKSIRTGKMGFYHGKGPRMD